MKKYSLFFVFLFAFNFCFADDVTITQYPDNPHEGQEIKLTLQSDKYDLNLANITWTIDGVEADSGIGRKTLTMNTSANSLGQVIVANITQDGFDPGQIQKVVEANTNFILYEGADSYVPSFYKGRRLPAKEGTVRAAIFSFQDGNIVGLDGGDNSNYTWKVNGEEKKDLSGQNKIINNILSKVTDSSLDISVTKTDEKGSKKTSENNIPLQKTEVIIYKTDQQKLLKQVLGNTEIGKSIYLLVEPFFFSVPDKRDNNLLYTWKINDVETKISTPWSAVFTGKDQDSVKINLDLVNNQKITQENSRGFTFKVK